MIKEYVRWFAGVPRGMRLTRGIYVVTAIATGATVVSVGSGIVALVMLLTR